MQNEYSSYLVKPGLTSAIAYSKKCQILTFICLALIAVIFQRGIQLELVSSVTDRIRFHAIPVAVSFLYHGQPHDYTALKDVAIPFQGAGPLHDLIADAVNKEVIQRDIYYWVADDKGFGDFVIVAFKLFGPKAFSMYLLWFVCLLFSTILFLRGFNHHLWALGLMGMVLAGVYVAISTLPLADEANFLNIQGKTSLSTVSIYETRFLDVLAMIPVIHICLFALCRKWPASALQIGALIGQACLFFFLYHARSSLGWQLAAMIGFLSLIIVYRLWRGRDKKVNNVTRFLRPAFVLVTLVTCLSILPIYKHASYNSRYFQDMGTRTFWHNALMGVSEPELAKKYNLAFGDLESARSVIKFAQLGACEISVARLDPQGLLNSLGGHGEQDWFAYENCAKKFYFSLWKNDSLRMTYNYLIAKPWASLGAVRKVAKSAGASASDTLRDRFSIGWHPFTGIPFAFAIVILLVANKALYRRRAMLLTLLGVLLATSLIPSIFFYPAILTLGGFFVTMTIICYMLCLSAIRGFVSWLYATP